MHLSENHLVRLLQILYDSVIAPIQAPTWARVKGGRLRPGQGLVPDEFAMLLGAARIRHIAVIDFQH